MVAVIILAAVACIVVVVAVLLKGTGKGTGPGHKQELAAVQPESPITERPRIAGYPAGEDLATERAYARRHPDDAGVVEQARLAHESFMTKEARIAQERRLAEEARIAEEKRLAELARAVEEEKLEKARQEEAARIEVESRAAEALLSSEWGKRISGMTEDEIRMELDRLSGESSAVADELARLEKKKSKATNDLKGIQDVLARLDSAIEEAKAWGRYDPDNSLWNKDHYRKGIIMFTVTIKKIDDSIESSTNRRAKLQQKMDFLRSRL